MFPRGYPKNPVTLGEQLRRRRLDLSLPQRILAERWRVTRETVAGWELGRCQPSIRHRPLVVEFLGLDPTPTAATLGGRLRAYRRKHGLTQAELGVRVGINEGTILDIEANRRKTSARVVALIEGLLARGRAPNR